MKNKSRTFKRAVCFALVLIFAFPAMIVARDATILTDPVQNTYIGRQNANRLIGQLQFGDLPINPAYRDAIIRSGALEIMRPGAETGVFRPNALITHEEAIAYSLRAAGLSYRAMAAVATVDLPDNAWLHEAWAMGYLQVASTLGMIETADFDAALTSLAMLIADEVEQEGGAAAGMVNVPAFAIGFDRTAPATREEVAMYMFTAFNAAESGVFDTQHAGVSLQSFSDWPQISPEAAPAVIALLNNQVITGQTSTVFGPNSSITRLQFAQFVRNLGDTHLNLNGLERRFGYVGATESAQFTDTGTGSAWTNLYVRSSSGEVNALQFSLSGGIFTPNTVSDAVVLRGGVVTGLAGLQVGDQIEYVIHPEDGTVWYVNVIGQATPQIFRGRLEIINMEDGTMTFVGAGGTMYTFPMSRGLYGVDHNGVPFIRDRNILHPADGFPRGTYYDVTLMGNVIVQIEFVGQPETVTEVRGIVLDINPAFGYLTILDANRRERSFTFNEAQLLVHRRQFFDTRDTIGGMHEMFPSVMWHPREASINDIIPGDVVVFRVADDDPLRITELHAAENTIQRYGRIREIRDLGGYFDIMVEFQNGQTTWYTFPANVRVLENGRPVSPNNIRLGDWANFTINQAILAPGVTMESVREIALDGGGHHITTILTGQLSGFNQSQNTLQIQHARELTPAGWSNHSPLASVNIGGQNIRYYFNGQPTTLANLNRDIQRTNATVYVALENHFAGERAVMISVRSGRDELIRTGTVLQSANNAFSLLEIGGSIQTDAGTIVVRDGRLVDPIHIFASDWARAAINGPLTAAVVDIGAPPATSGVQIVRGRIAQVLPFDSFRVETLSIFDGFRWNFTPIAREFTIDHDTLFIGEGGVTSIDSFIGHTDASVVGQVFNVIVDGGRAVRVIDAPFTEPIPQLVGAPGHLTVRGIIYEITGNTMAIRDMTVYNGRTGAWERVSVINPTGVVVTLPNTIIVDRNEVIPASRLQVGQQILAFTPTRRDEVDIEPGLSADAFIVLVER